MTSPELQLIVDLLRAGGGLAPDLPIDEQRTQYEQALAAYPVDADVSIESVAPAGVPCEWVAAPGAGRDRSLLYLHGGAYVIGGLATHRELAARLSKATASRVLLAGYRLAPENPFPAALEDAVAVARWLASEVPSRRSFAIAGDSAGGGLVVSSLHALRDAGEQLPAAAVCLSPWVDLTNSGASQEERAKDDPVLSKAWLDKMAELYLCGADPSEPSASPLFADLAGLPPLLVQVGTREVLYDDAVRLCERASAAGVECELQVFEGCIHLWQQLAALSPEAASALSGIGEFVGSHLG